MLNPGPSIQERAAALARGEQISFREALRQLARRGARARAARRRTHLSKDARRAAYVSRLEQQKLF